MLLGGGDCRWLEVLHVLLAEIYLVMRDWGFSLLMSMQYG